MQCLILWPIASCLKDGSRIKLLLLMVAISASSMLISSSKAQEITPNDFKSIAHTNLSEQFITLTNVLNNPSASNEQWILAYDAKKKYENCLFPKIDKVVDNCGMNWTCIGTKAPAVIKSQQAPCLAKANKDVESFNSQIAAKKNTNLVQRISSISLCFDGVKKESGNLTGQDKAYWHKMCDCHFKNGISDLKPTKVSKDIIEKKIIPVIEKCQGVSISSKQKEDIFKKYDIK